MVNRVLTRDEFAEVAEDLLCDGREVRFRAHGQSMRPFIRDGETVVVEAVEQQTLQVGDIVFFRGPSGRGVMHRVVRREGQVLVTRGDALRRAVERVKAVDVVGRVVGVERNGAVVPLSRGSRQLAGWLWLLLYPVRYVVGGVRRRFRRIG